MLKTRQRLWDTSITCGQIIVIWASPHTAAAAEAQHDLSFPRFLLVKVIQK